MHEGGIYEEGQMNKEAFRKRLWRAKRQAEKKLSREGFAVWGVIDPGWYATLIAIKPTSAKAKLVRIATPECYLSELNCRKPAGNIPLEIWIREKHDFRILSRG